MTEAIAFSKCLISNITAGKVVKYGTERFPAFAGIILLWFLFAVALAYNTLRSQLQYKILFNHVLQLIRILTTQISQLVISLILWPIIAPIILIFGVLRQAVTLILKIKYKEDFGGLLHGADNVWTIEDESKAIINTLLFIEHDDDSPREFLYFVRKTIFDKFFSNPSQFIKLKSSRHTFLGYCYSLKNQMGILDCVKPFNINADRKTESGTELEDLISRLLNSPMALNDSSFWEVLVGNKRVEHGNTLGNPRMCYPVIFRFHHTLGDGASLFTVLVQCLADNIAKRKEKSFFAHFEKYNSDVRHSDHSRFNVKNPRDDETLFLKKKRSYIDYIRTGYLALITPGTLSFELARKVDKNSLHKSKLSGEKLVAYLTEDNSFFVPLLKSMKIKLRDYRFSDIVLASISDSFAQFFRKYSETTPEDITVVVPAMPSISEFNFNSKQDMRFENSFSVGVMSLAISNINTSENNGTPCMERLKKVKTEADKLRSSPTYQMNYWLINVVAGVLPTPILRHILRSPHCTLVVSIVPGTEKLTVFNHKQITDIVCLIPNKDTTGVSLSVLTYDNKFQLGLTVDKLLITEKEKAQEIVDGFFKYLLALSNEIERNC